MGVSVCLCVYVMVGLGHFRSGCVWGLLIALWHPLATPPPSLECGNGRSAAIQPQAVCALDKLRVALATWFLPVSSWSWCGAIAELYSCFQLHSLRVVHTNMNTLSLVVIIYSGCSVFFPVFFVLSFLFFTQSFALFFCFFSIFVYTLFIYRICLPPSK